MPAHQQRVQWVRSPRLVPDVGPLDLDYLEHMTLGDTVLEREVLAMFLEQSRQLMRTIATWPADITALARILKGSARAIGAFAVAEAAARLKVAVESGEGRSGALAELQDAVAEACEAIDAILQ